MRSPDRRLDGVGTHRVERQALLQRAPAARLTA